MNKNKLIIGFFSLIFITQNFYGAIPSTSQSFENLFNKINISKTIKSSEPRNSLGPIVSNLVSNNTTNNIADNNTINSIVNNNNQSNLIQNTSKLKNIFNIMFKNKKTSLATIGICSLAVYSIYKTVKYFKAKPTKLEQA